MTNAAVSAPVLFGSNSKRLPDEQRLTAAGVLRAGAERLARLPDAPPPAVHALASELPRPRRLPRTPLQQRAPRPRRGRVRPRGRDRRARPRRAPRPAPDDDASTPPPRPPRRAHHYRRRRRRQLRLRRLPLPAPVRRRR